MAEKNGFFAKLKAGLSKTRDSIVSGIENVFMGYSVIDEEFYDELEEAMIMGDLGMNTSETIIESLKDEAAKRYIQTPGRLEDLLIEIIKEKMAVPKGAYDFEKKQSVVFVIGVNGVGKTTSIGKLASRYKAEGKKVMLAAADTFRAAAIDQLNTWANRAGVPIIAQKEGSDPSSVIFDAVHSAKSKGTDILLCDTAGRLHNKKNLMDELKKMNRVISQEFPEAYRENLLVLDASTGQNAINQAKEFMQAADITGIILTKMDGTAKGGMAIAIQSELNIPVKYIGIGEKIEDLERFDPVQFTDALFDKE